MFRNKPQAIVSIWDSLAYYEENIFILNVGDVIFLENSAKDYETFIGNLSKFASLSSIIETFTVYPNLVGSEQYTLYGAGTFTVIGKS